MLKHYLKAQFLVFLLGLFISSCGIIPPPYGYYERMGIERPEKVAKNTETEEEESEFIDKNFEESRSTGYCYLK